MSIIVYTLKTHCDFTAACEQLADDLNDFETECRELKIKVKGPLNSYSTQCWLDKNCVCKMQLQEIKND